MQCHPACLLWLRVAVPGWGEAVLPTSQLTAQPAAPHCTPGNTSELGTARRALQMAGHADSWLVVARLCSSRAENMKSPVIPNSFDGERRQLRSFVAQPSRSDGN